MLKHMRHEELINNTLSNTCPGGLCGDGKSIVVCDEIEAVLLKEPIMRRGSPRTNF